MKYESPTVLVVGNALEEVQGHNIPYKNAGGNDGQGCSLYCFSELDD